MSKYVESRRTVAFRAHKDTESELFLEEALEMDPAFDRATAVPVSTTT